MPPISQFTGGQRHALTRGRTVQWVADAYQIPRRTLLALIAAEGWVIDPATDTVHARRAVPTGIHPRKEADPMPSSSDTAAVLDALRAGTLIPQVAAAHGWPVESVTALANGQKGWTVDPANGTVRVRADGTGQAEEATTPAPAPEPEPEPAAAPEPTPAEILAGGIEQLLTDARGCGDKRIERAAAKADTAIGAVADLYGPWLAEQNAARERAAELAKAENRAAKLRAQYEKAQAEVAALKGKPARSTPKAEQDRNRAIRQWAAGEGIVLFPRGKIPAHVVAQYNIAHPGGGDG